MLADILKYIALIEDVLLYHEASAWYVAMNKYVHEHNDIAVRESSILDFISKCNSQILVTDTTWEYTHMCSKKTVYDMLRIVRSIPDVSQQLLFCSTVERYSIPTVCNNIISSLFCAKIHVRNLELYNNLTFVEPVLDFGPEVKANIKINNILIHDKFSRFSRLVRGIYLALYGDDELEDYAERKVHEKLVLTNSIIVYQDDDFKAWICNTLNIKEMLKVVDEVDTVEKFVSTTITNKRLLATFIDVQTYFEVSSRLADGYNCDY